MTRMNGTDDRSPPRWVRNLGRNVVAVAGDEVLDDAEQQPAGERDRDRAQAAERRPRRANRARPA